jgi:hypothetical protein
MAEMTNSGGFGHPPPAAWYLTTSRWSIGERSSFRENLQDSGESEDHFVCPDSKFLGETAA